MLYIIGIGLNDPKDISLKGLEAVKKCEEIYLENYTSKLACSVKDLEKLYGKKIILAERSLVEENFGEIIDKAKTKDIALLIIGDALSATTHIEIFKQAKEKQVECNIIHNASVLTAVGITGLQLYNFGKTTSIPFPEDNFNPETAYDVIKQNNDLHTLCLLDLRPSKDKFMTIKQAIEILLEIEAKKGEKIITEETLVIGCAKLGSEQPIIKQGKVKDIVKQDFKQPPFCLIIPGKLHFVEEEVIKFYMI